MRNGHGESFTTSFGVKHHGAAHLSVKTNTELLNEPPWLRGWVLYDGDCAFCVGWASRVENILTRRGFDLAPLQTPWVVECLGEEARELREMKVLTREGQEYGGADAILFLCGRVWWAWPVWLLGHIPAVRFLLRRAYGWIAAKRHCLGTDGACKRS